MQGFVRIWVKNTKNKNAHKMYKNAMNIHWVEFFLKDKITNVLQKLIDRCII